MNIFFFLGQTFFDQTLMLAREFKGRYQDSEFSAIVASRYNLIEELDKTTNPKFKRYDWLSDLERKWLNTPLDREKLKKYENMLGTEVLRRIVIADRELGYGYVSCGIVERTAIINRTINNDEARWSYVVGLLDYFFTAFEKDKIDIVFAYCVAGAVAMAMGQVANYLGVTFMQPIFPRIGEFHILDDNPCWDFNTVKEFYKKAYKDQNLIKDTLPKAVAFLENFRNNPMKPDDTATWIKLILKNTSLYGMSKTIIIDIARWIAIKLGLQGTKGVLRQRNGLDILLFNLKNAFALRKLSQKEHPYFSYDLPKGDYIYYPLHVDPEASTMVITPFCTDQMVVIEAIAKNMPAGMKLVVKEHIPCAGKRPQGFYKRLSQIPGVSLVTPLMDSFTLTKNAKLITTITGTVGMEAIMLKKPLLSFGQVGYLAVENGFVYHPDINNGLDQAIIKATNVEPTPDKNIHTFIASVMQMGVDISPKDMWYEHLADITKREKGIREMADKMISIYENNKTKNKIKVA